MTIPTVTEIVHSIGDDCFKDGVLTREQATEWANETLLALKADDQNTKWVEAAFQRIYQAGFNDGKAS